MSSSITNPFQKAAAEYLGIQGVSNGAGTSAFTIDQQVFIVGYQGPTGGGTSRGWEVIATTPDTVYLDAHTRDGVFNDYDYRMQFNGGYAGAQGGGQLICEGRQTTFYMPLRTNPPGAPLPPSWYLDYGQTDATAGPNQATAITFNTTFDTVPKLQLTLIDKNGAGSGNQDNVTLYVETITTAGASVRGYGTMGPDMAFMWLAIGGPAP
jgi:hypothetical protein